MQQITSSRPHRYEAAGVPGFFLVRTGYGFGQIDHCMPIEGERFATRSEFVGSVPRLPDMSAFDERCREAIRAYVDGLQPARA